MPARNETTCATQAEEQQTLIAVIESSSDFIGIATPTGQVLYVNQAGQELVGWEGSSAALRSMTFYDFHPEEDATFMREQFVEGLLHHEHWEGELRLKHFKTGLPIPIHSSACLVKHSRTREPIAIAMIGRDSTERTRMEEAIRESERRLSRILESAMDAIISIDEKRRVSLFNAAAEKVFRCPATEVIGRPFDRFLSDRFRHLLEGYVRVFVRGGEAEHPMWAPEGLTARRADGEEFPIEATISRVEVAGQRLYTIILRDIDERKQAEEELRKLQLENVYLQEEIKTEYNFEEIVGASRAIKKVFQHVERVASTDSTVLLTGETGTGKELIARAIHNLSARKNSVLVKVNCAALPDELVESELFGHEKGAFTGALTRKKGRFELAHGGTIFLDEVGELPVAAQTKLLRVLQEHEFERVGGTQTFQINVRVIAATNRDLEEAVKRGAFRADLFYRLHIFPIHVPALRERWDDISLLTNYFIDKFSRRIGKRIDGASPKALEKLTRYDWPGNVRELANIIERAVILCDGRILQPDHLGVSNLRPVTDREIATLQEAERSHILKALEKTKGVVGGPHGVAQLLGLRRTTLISRMKKLGISKTF